MVEGEGVIYWNNCGVWKKAVEVPEAFICEGAFIKIECFKIPTKRFPFSIFFWGGGGVGGWVGALIRKNVEFKKRVWGVSLICFYIILFIFLLKFFFYSWSLVCSFSQDLAVYPFSDHTLRFSLPNYRH